MQESRRIEVEAEGNHRNVKNEQYDVQQEEEHSNCVDAVETIGDCDIRSMNETRRQRLLLKRTVVEDIGNTTRSHGHSEESR
jgi:hypothetical protein